MQNYQQEVSDSLFLLLVNQSIHYILSKKLDKKKEKEQIEEIGFQLGEKTANYLLNDNNTKVNFDKNSIMSYIEFLAQPVWNYIFKNGFCEITHNDKNMSSYTLNCGDLKIYNYLITEKSNQNDEKLEASLNFICGIIKGVLNVFNLECVVIPNVLNYSQELVKNLKNIPLSQFIFTFNINIFLNANESNQMIETQIIQNDKKEEKNIENEKK